MIIIRHVTITSYCPMDCWHGGDDERRTHTIRDGVTTTPTVGTTTMTFKYHADTINWRTPHRQKTTAPKGGLQISHTPRMSDDEPIRPPHWSKRQKTNVTTEPAVLLDSSRLTSRLPSATVPGARGPRNAISQRAKSRADRLAKQRRQV